MINNNKNKKKDPTTKRVFVSAKYLLTEVALDKNTIYPVNISIRTGRAESFWAIHDKEELIDIINSPYVLESGIIKFLKKKDRTCVDMRQRGMLEIKREILPYVGHNATLVSGQASELYDILAAS